MGSAIVLDGVSKTYGAGVTEVHALRRVDVEVPSGQFVVILGPSGSGKTTLLNIVGAIDEPTSGILEVDGVNLVGLEGDEQVSFRRASVGFIFQFFNLIPSLTAAENVELVADLTSHDGAAHAREVLAQVGLGERSDHFPSQLSGGEQQRVAVARALVKEPSILLCDEPTGELDFETGRMILALLRRLSDENGQTVLLVTHNAAIGAMGDRVIRLRDGEVAEDILVEVPLPATELTW